MKSWIRIEKKEYSRCLECGKKVVKEYPKTIHEKCFERWAKKEVKQAK
jgi:hypothetical protein